MLFGAIAWTADGYDVEVVDAAGTRARPPISFPAGSVGELAGYLTQTAAQRGEPVAAVVDSTNGVIDGLLMSAGLTVYRADPWQLPAAGSGFGSAPASALAEVARTGLAGLTRLQPDIGTLTGRGSELAAAKAAGDHAEAERGAGPGCLRHGRRDRAEVALSFDDGPNPPFTDEILAILARYRVPATFFCVGLHALAWPEQLARMIDAGHTVANHTWSHPYLPDLSRAQLIEQVERTEARLPGRGLPLFRPPYGSRSPQVLTWLRELGSPVALWDVDPQDWARPGPAAITDAVLSQTRPGSIVLMHDGGGDRSQTVAALPAVIEGLLERGYRLVTVDAFASGR
jgi:peptidoglycan/xylan/chitin deacetylase (PgdA/CDA1 family)